MRSSMLPAFASILLLCVPTTAEQMTALFVVGAACSDAMYADKIYKERLERQAYTVTLIKDSDEGLKEACESHDIMLISASISGGAVNTQLNDCTTPQMIWESRLYSYNGMQVSPLDEALRVTSAFFHENHEVAFKGPEQVPPYPTGPEFHITQNGSESPLAGGLTAGPADFWTVNDYGMNYIDVSQLGKGAHVVAILPPSKTSEFPVKPEGEKATLFYYEKGDELCGDLGRSPAFRIGWPAFGFCYGASPSCEEVANTKCVDNSCQDNCQTKEQIINSGVNPSPLSCHGMQTLDSAISTLTQEARKGKAQPAQQKSLIQRHLPAEEAGIPMGSDGAAFIQMPRSDL